MPQSGASHDASTDYYAVLEITPDATGEASTPRQECDGDSIRNHTEQLLYPLLPINTFKSREERKRARSLFPPRALNGFSHTLEPTFCTDSPAPSPPLSQSAATADRPEAPAQKLVVSAAVYAIPD